MAAGIGEIREKISQLKAANRTAGGVGWRSLEEKLLLAESSGVA